jgi:hypothetical protein
MNDTRVGPARFAIALFCAMMAGVAVAMIFGKPDPAWRALTCQVPLTPGAIVRIAVALGMAGGGAAFIRGLVHGLPELTISADRVAMRYPLGGVRWARWDSLGPFEIMNKQSQFQSESQIPYLRARLTGPNADPRSAGVGKFYVPTQLLAIRAEEALALLNRSGPPA